MFGISPMMLRELVDYKMKKDSTLLDLQRQELARKDDLETRKLEVERSKLSALADLERSKISALSSISSSSSAPTIVAPTAIT